MRPGLVGGTYFLMKWIVRKHSSSAQGAPPAGGFNQDPVQKVDGEMGVWLVSFAGGAKAPRINRQPAL